MQQSFSARMELGTLWIHDIRHRLLDYQDTPPPQKKDLLFLAKNLVSFKFLCGLVLI